MQNENVHIKVLEALAAGTDPETDEAFPIHSPYGQAQVIKALRFAINQLKTLAQKGNQGQPWTTEEDEVLLKHFNQGIKITELARLHNRSYNAIKARLIKLKALQK